MEQIFLQLFLGPAINFFRLLRLFKSGRLVAGESFVVFCGKAISPETWGTALSKRCSEMAIDYGLLNVQAGSYSLLSSAVPFFNFFSETVSPLLDSQCSSLSQFRRSEVSLPMEGLFAWSNGAPDSAKLHHFCSRIANFRPDASIPGSDRHVRWLTFAHTGDTGAPGTRSGPTHASCWFCTTCGAYLGLVSFASPNSLVLVKTRAPM